MITVRHASDRRHTEKTTHQVWKTFYSLNPAAPSVDHFGALQALNEERFPPGNGFPRRSHRDAEVITYVREGTLNYEDSAGGEGVIHAGKFQRMTAGSGIDRSETNGSKLEWAQVFQIWLHPNRVGLAPNVEREHFRRAQRRGGLRIVASQDGRDESLRVNQDARIYSGVFPPGQRVVHELAIGRTAWLHIVNGEIRLGDSVFRTGDGIGLIAERAVAFTTQSAAEVLLIDLGAPIPPPGGNGSAAS